MNGDDGRRLASLRAYEELADFLTVEVTATAETRIREHWTLKVPTSLWAEQDNDPEPLQDWLLEHYAEHGRFLRDYNIAEADGVTDQQFEDIVGPYTAPPDGPVAAFRTVQEALRPAADSLADLIVRTLAAMFPGAAHLRLRGNDDEDDVTLDAIVDADGEVRHEFHGGPWRRLPAVQDPALIAAWGEHDYRDPQLLENLVHETREAGLNLPELPAELRDGESYTWAPCLSLTGE